jgi:hypothetical protein
MTADFRDNQVVLSMSVDHAKALLSYALAEADDGLKQSNSPEESNRHADNWASVKMLVEWMKAEGIWGNK